MLGLLMAGKTQQEAADAVGKSRGYVLRAERGAVSRRCMTPVDRSHLTPQVLGSRRAAARRAESRSVDGVVAEIREWVARCLSDVYASQEMRRKLAESADPP